MPMTYLSPFNIKQVDGLVGKRLHAALTTRGKMTGPITCQFQLTEQKPGEHVDWRSRIWDAEVAAVRTFVFSTIDGCAAHDGVVVGSATPKLTLTSVVPMKAITWRLLNDGSRLQHGGPASVAISADGLRATLTPKKELRRSGEKQAWHLSKGVFLPPFSWSKGRYNSRTYHGHSDFSVDLNRHPDDRGDPVRAAAQGTVSRFDPSQGVLDIKHSGGWVTHYGHMTNIPPALHTIGAPVAAHQQIGKIGSVGPGITAAHLHHRHLLNGVPRKMRFEGEEMDASLKSVPAGQVVFGQNVRGPRRRSGVSKAAYRVAIKRQGDGRWSGFGRLEFVVAAKGAQPCTDGAGGEQAVWFANVAYDGTELLPGTYLIRYRCRDGAGNRTGWMEDHIRIAAN